MASENSLRFEEKILFRTRQHWIIPVVRSLQFFIIGAIPATIVFWFLTDYSVFWTSFLLILLLTGGIGYRIFLWYHSWLLIGNQKITLSVRNGIFSQYAMNIRYRNIRDSAVSKNTILGYLLKYGTIFLRSTAAEGDFMAQYVPKVGKVYALVNALSRYSDDERSRIDTIEKLHEYHQNQEFSGNNSLNQGLTVDQVKTLLALIPGIVGVEELMNETRKRIILSEEEGNIGVHEVLKRKYVVCFLHDSSFRLPATPIVETYPDGRVIFPPVPFPEIPGSSVVSASPSSVVHRILLTLFPYASGEDATVLIGWDE